MLRLPPSSLLTETAPCVSPHHLPSMTPASLLPPLALATAAAAVSWLVRVRRSNRHRRHDACPVLYVISRNGRPVWRACRGGRCVEGDSGASVLAQLRQLNTQPQPLPGPSGAHRRLKFWKE